MCGGIYAYRLGTYIERAFWDWVSWLYGRGVGVDWRSRHLCSSGICDLAWGIDVDVWRAKYYRITEVYDILIYFHKFEHFGWIDRYLNHQNSLPASGLMHFFIHVKIHENQFLLGTTSNIDKCRKPML